MTQPSPAITRRALLRAITTSGALAASAVVVGCSTTAKQPQGATPTPPMRRSNVAAPGTLVMIIRHGEKPDKKSGTEGVDSNGNPADNSSLTQVGWNRARALAVIFDPPDGRLRPGLARPKQIYAAGANDAGEGERTRETITPLAQRLALPINTDFGKGQEYAMAAQISALPGPTLICWQHGEIPAIAEAFGTITPTPPSTWPADRFDVIWTLTATPTGWNFTQIPELALPTDQTGTISG